MRIQLNEPVKPLRPTKVLYSTAEQKDLSHDYILYYCDNCGAELCGAWKYLYYTWGIPDNDQKKFSALFKTIKQEKDNIRALKVCPVCGAPLSRAPGYFAQSLAWASGCEQLENFWHKDFEHEDLLFAEMKLLRQESQLMLDQAKQLGQSFDLPARANVSPAAIAEINATPAGLQEYIKNLLTLEAGIYSVTNRLADLYIQKKEAEQEMRHDKFRITAQYNGKTETCPPDEEEQKARKYAATCKAELEAIPMPKLPAKPQTPAKPIYEAPGLFNKKKVQAKNELLLAQYKADMSAYEKEMGRYNEQVQNLNAEYQSLVNTAKAKYDAAKQELDTAQKSAVARKAQWEQEAKERQAQELENALATLPSRTIRDRVEQEITDTTARMQQLYRCRNELYSYDVVFGKYRDPVALATFYEYLMSGRCESLTGAQGAYNLYESECRANLIISQLDGVLKSLEQIKSTQYMIYSSIQMANESLMQLNQTASKAAESIRSMGGSVQQLARNSELAAHNTAVTAYYARLDSDVAYSTSYMRARFP